MGKTHSLELIVRKLQQAEARLAAEATIPEVAGKLVISDATFHCGKNRYGGMRSSEAKRLKDLEKENVRFRVYRRSSEAVAPILGG